MNRLLDKSEVSKILLVSVRTVDRLRQSGELKALRVRGSIRFSEDDVRAYLESQRPEEVKS
jgi:excisionase family DNA binding protein